MKKLLAMLICSLLLVTPVLGGAQNIEVGYISLNNPYIYVSEEINGEEIEFDLAGLTLQLSAEEADNALHFLAQVLAQGNEAVSAYLKAGEDGITATASAMQSAAHISMDGIMELVEDLASELSLSAEEMMENPLGAFPTFPTEEELVASASVIGEVFSKFVDGIEITDPVPSTVELHDKSVVTTQQIRYTISPATFGSMLVDLYDIILTFRPDMAQELKDNLGTQMSDDELKAALAEAPFSAEGTVDVAEDGTIYTVNFLNTPDEGKILVNCNMPETENGLEFFATIFPDMEDGTECCELYFSLSPNEYIEDKKDVYATLTFGTIVDKAPDPEMQCELIFSAILDENSVPKHYAQVSISEEGITIAKLLFDVYADENVHGFFASMESLESAMISVGYDGKVGSGNVATTGEFWVEGANEDKPVMSFQIEVEIGKSDTSIVQDLSGKNMVDILQADEETLSALEEECSQALQSALLVLIGSMPALIEML